MDDTTCLFRGHVGVFPLRTPPQRSPNIAQMPTSCLSYLSSLTTHSVRLWAIVTAAVLGGLCARLAWGGLPVQISYPFATTILLDAGSRINDGQVPYQDFHTPIGFTYLWLVSLCLRLADGLPHALALLSAGLGLVIGAWCWWLAIARCPPALAAVVALLGGLLAASPALFGYGPLEVSYGGHYSRLAWAVFFSVIVQAALPVRVAVGTVGASRTWGEGVGLGLCLGLLLGTKFTVLFAALAVLAIAWCYRRPDRRLVLAMVVAALIATLAGLYASGASLAAYLRDCSGLGGAVSLGTLLLHYQRKLDLLGLALVAALVIWNWRVLGASWRCSWRQPVPEVPALAAAVLALGLVISATTGIEDASPGYLLAILVLACGGRTRLPGSMLVAGAMLGAFAARLAVPIIKSPYAAASHQLTLAAGPWRNLDFMPAVPGTTEREDLIRQVWVQPRNLVDNLWYFYLADADRLLRPRVGPAERVLSMDYMNPFPYLLGRPAPRGDLLYWSFDRNVTPKTAPAARDLFADADWVMVPKLEVFHDSSAPKQRLYLGWIIDHYHLEETSVWWDCYRRVR